jgi:hypothetical protein
VISIEIPDVQVDRLLDQFKQFSRKAQNEIAFSAVFEASQPMVEAARAAAPSETGSLKQSMGVAMRKKKWRVYAVIGPRWGFGKDGREPARYAHLVEYGHRVAHKKTGKLKRKTLNMDTKSNEIPAHPFMRPAWEATKAAVFAKLKDVFGREVNAWATRKGGSRVK